ncbi:N-acetylglucosamine-1-phosphotransferase subunits alpha/beta-like [Ruditapes philippinarum]|uniref:N-acetylglucosamine-1-phosphotransferase subunits alpha/beta-like n=1 Tax=Ruditapes philippinarum TaxID=129788 RepID=UPI00295C11B4|nr:N-acetylglucosamine-1-phosphotransferase subunits alpha/beta-like [Ruditapes philippinarum]
MLNRKPQTVAQSINCHPISVCFYFRSSEITAKRCRDWRNLRYALRSVEKYADWINHVFLVTNGQVPNWLNTGYHKVSIVKHSIRFGAKKVPNYMDKCNKFNLNRSHIEKFCYSSGCKWNGKYCFPTEQAQSRLIMGFNEPFHWSLVYTSIAFDKAFEHAQRGVPAHAPYITDVDTMDALQDRFPKEWERTSANRFRDPHSFQHGFAYYHFLMLPKTNTCREEITRPIATSYNDYEDYAYIATGNFHQLHTSLANL